MSKNANRRPSEPQTVHYSVSQNFLTSARTIDRLLDLTDIGPADTVWEIGAGKGHITRRLLGRAGRVTAAEIDPALCARLRGTLAGYSGLRLLEGDFLRMALPTRGAYKVFANIPFHLTSAIIERLALAPNAPMDCWLVLEKGAAKRFLGIPRETPRSLWLKTRFEGRICCHLRREDFHPVPSVDTVLVHLRRRERPDLSPGQRDAFMRFARALLQHGFGGRGMPSRHQASVALRHAGAGDIPQSATLSYVQWLCLFRWWARLPQTAARR